MNENLLNSVLVFIILLFTPQYKVVFSSAGANSTYEDLDGDKSSLVFVFDTTGSMHNDLKQLRDGAEMILDTALEDSNAIADFVFVPFHDPVVGPATVTRDKEVFKTALGRVTVYGGGDCPEKSLGGIQLALNVSRPHSFVYVFTDATAGDHRLVGKVLDTVQRRQSQVVFVLTGHCNDLHKPQYKVYEQIAAASSGQVFNLNKTNVHKVLDFVKSSIKGRTVNLGSIVLPAGRSYTQEIPVDASVGEVTVSVAGPEPAIRVVAPSGQVLAGPPRLFTVLDLAEIMVVKVLQPEPGNWSVTTASADTYSVRVVGLSNLTFSHGFSVQKPSSVAETSYRPLQGTYNYMTISLTHTDGPVNVTCAEIITLNGTCLFEIPLRVFDGEKKVYIAEPFVPPDDFFYVAISGRDQYNQELRRVGATAVQAKTPDVPYLIVTQELTARSRDRVVLSCSVDSLVPVTAFWSKGDRRVQDPTSSLQSTSIDYVIEDMGEGDVGAYTCVARNVAGLSRAVTEVTLLVNPPLVTMALANQTAYVGGNVTVSCTAISEAPLTKLHLTFNGTQNQYIKEMSIEPNVEGLYTFNKTIKRLGERDNGIYSCIAANRGGQSIQSTHIYVQSKPIAQILGPHSLTRLIHSSIQLVCHVENADKVVWLAHNGSVIKMYEVDGSLDDVLDVRDLDEDGVWTCVASRGSYKARDSVEITVLIKPEVSIEGPTNVTILDGTAFDIACKITAKPAPRIIWHCETERFLNNTVITQLQPNVYKSVLTLDSAKESVNRTYFCIGENSLGIDEGSVTVQVRRKMELVEGFGDKSVELYSQVELPCRIDTYPPPRGLWRHNGTEIVVSENVRVSDSGTALYLLKIDFSDLGTYVCEADNGYEKLYVEGRLSVFGLETPVLFKDPATVTVKKSASTIITCRVMQGKPEPSISWQFKPTTSEVFTTLSDGAAISEDLRSVRVANADVRHGGVYRCTAENVVGRDVYDAVLVVHYPPQFNQDSEDAWLYTREVKAGSNLTFSCKVTGFPPPVVVWSKDSHPISYSKYRYFTDDNELVLAAASEHDTGLYTCHVSSVLGALHKNFTLIVYVPPTISLPGIEPQLEVLEGQLVELPCRAQGVPNPSVQWLQNGIAVTEGRKHVHDFGLRFVANLTDFGEYTCVAENKYGNSSVSYTVYIWVAPYIEPPLETSKDVLKGSDLTLQCDAVGFPIPTIVWEFQGELLQKNSSDLSFDDIGHVFVKNASAKHDGSYACIAENIAGISMKTTYLVVNEPPRMLDDFAGPYIATDRDTVLVLTCRAAGSPAPFVVWAKDGRYLDNDSQHVIGTDGTLTIASPSEHTSGLYTCVAKNAIGLANRTVHVDVYPLPARTQADESRATVAVVEGMDATVQCPARSTHQDSVKWYKDAKLVANETLIFRNVTRENAASYACVATNVIGSSYSTVYIDVQWKPTFFGSVRGEIGVLGSKRDKDVLGSVKSDMGVMDSKKGRMDVLGSMKTDMDVLGSMNTDTNVLGSMKSDMDVRDTTKGGIDILGSMKSDMGVMDSKKGDIDVLGSMKSDMGVMDTKKGRMDVLDSMKTDMDVLGSMNTDTNVVGSRKSHMDVLDSKKGEMHLLVNDRAVVEVLKGDDTYFDCGVDAKPIAKTKWMFNSWPLPGEDSARLRLMNTQPHHAGTYECVVSNVHGGVSREFTLDVLEPPFISEFDVLDVELIEGDNVTLDCNARGEPAPNIRWSFNNTSWQPQNSSLTTSNVSTTSEGVFRCDATNRAGTSHIVYRVIVGSPARVAGVTAYRGGRGESVGGGLEVQLGAHIRLSCSSKGNPSPTTQWMRNGEVLSRNDPHMSSADLVLEAARATQGGVYVCVAYNEVSVDERKILLDVLEPPTISQGLQSPEPSEATVVEVMSGAPFVLPCHPSGNPPPEIYWFRDGLPLRFFDTTMVSKHYGEVIVVDAANPDQSGNYTCVARNKVGEASVVYSVDVLVPPPTPKESSRRVATRFGGALALNCPAAGSPPPRVAWLKHPYTEIGQATPRVQLVNDNFTLVINNTQVSDSGEYSCIMTNKAGSTEVVFAVTIEKAPTIAGYVLGDESERRVVRLGRSDVLKCQADGHPTPEIRWLKDTQELSGSMSDVQSALGGSLLGIWRAQTRHAAQYICVAENSAGVAHRRYQLIVQVPGKWGDWSSWSLCNATCGLGYQLRSRLCQYVDERNITIDKTTFENILLDESACKGPTNDRRRCHMPPCEMDGESRWGAWSKWHPCSSSCGEGVQARTRRCRGRDCVGDNVQIRKCPDLPKCSKRNAVENDVYNSGESNVETSAYIPEATFETQPEVISKLDIEEIYGKPESKYTPLYHDVNVTAAARGSGREACRPGYRHNATSGSCQDIDECLMVKNQCHSTQACVNTPGAYRCTCTEGFVSLGVGQRCLDINECEQDIHGCEFACVNVAGGYVCACPKHLRLHADKHRCVAPSSYRKPYSHEELEPEGYLGAAVDFPARYTKTRD